MPVKVEFDYNAAGKPTGEANVDFSTHAEAKEAMKKHKANMRTCTQYASCTITRESLCWLVGLSE